MIKEQDIDYYIRNNGFERGVVVCLHQIIERQSVQAQEIKALADLLDQMTNMIGTMTIVGEQMKSALDTLNGMRQEGLEDG